jgi:acetyl esterase
MVWFWDHYLGADGDGSDPLASPLRASNLTGLPAATVITAEFDPLRDEGEAFAAGLERAGVSVRARRHDGQIHGFWQMGGVMPAAKDAINEVAADLRDGLS